MAIFETFSKRLKKQDNAGKQDVYQYDDLPGPFRVQVIHIWNSAIGSYWKPQTYSHSTHSPANKFWKFIHDTIAREHGVFLLGKQTLDPDERCKEYLMTADAMGALDIIELSFRVIDRLVGDLVPHERSLAKITQTPDEAIEELNHRFREHGIGFQFEGGCLFRVDSQFLHAEAVRPALSLLNDPGFAGAKEEFGRAFDHYRKGDHKGAVSEACKSFESTMKAVCAARNWSYPSNATAKSLLDILFANALIPRELQSHFAGFRSAMESGLPTIGNKTSRHGQGPQSVPIPPYLAAHALHLTASNIVLLVQAHKANK